VQPVRSADSLCNLTQNRDCRGWLARLLPDGARDLTFRPDTDRVSIAAWRVWEFDGPIAVQPDGKILVAGNQQLSRLNPDASIDHSLRRRCPIVKSMLLRSNRRPHSHRWEFLASGETLRWGIARLSPRGALDTRFQSTLRVRRRIRTSTLHRSLHLCRTPPEEWSSLVCSKLLANPASWISRD